VLASLSRAGLVLQLASRLSASVRGGTGLAGVGKQALTRIGGDREGLERELKIPDDRVVDELDAGGVDPAQEAGEERLKIAAVKRRGPSD
jgi:hypothetical protein